MYKIFGYLSSSPDVVSHCRYIKKLELGVGCPHNCTYCFVPSLRREILPGSFKPLDTVKALQRGFNARDPRLFDGLAFRCSTNTDPFSAPYHRSGLAKKVLDWLNKYNQQVLIVTKSPNISAPEYLHTLKELKQKQLIAVTMTVITVAENVRKMLEPGASSIDKRLDTMRVLSQEGIRVVARIQPLIPGINDDKEQMKQLVEKVAETGAQHVVAEFLRLEQSIWRRIKPIVVEKGLKKQYEQLYRVSNLNSRKLEFQKVAVKAYKIARLKFLRDLCTEYNMGFTTCKEGFYELHTLPDCCGGLLPGTARPSGYEIYMLAKKRNRGLAWSAIEKASATTPYLKQLKRMWDSGALAHKILGITCTKVQGETVYHFEKEQLEKWGI